MLACYRKTDANDPEIYGRAVVAVLMRYPPDTVMAVTEPATGLPSKVKWLPTIAEIVEACDDTPAVRQQRRVQKVLAPREIQRLSDAELGAQFRRLGLGFLHGKPPSGTQFQPPDTSRAPFHVPTDDELRATYPPRSPSVPKVERPAEPERERHAEERDGHGGLDGEKSVG
jgi:hypothetical protein